MPRNYRGVRNNLEVEDEKNLSTKLRLTQNAVLMDTVKNRIAEAFINPFTAIPWDNVDEEFLAVPRKWDASSVGNFMIWIGPTSSIFDFTTYIFMYFVFCPLFVSNGVLFNDLANHFAGSELEMMQFKYAAMFQTGWFNESMWSQTLVIHMIRTPKLPFIHRRASLPLILLTFTGIAVLTIIPFTPFGALLGFVALPASYFAYLVPCILLYMMLATSLKKAYIRHFGELL